MVTIRAAHTGETLLKVSTFQVLPNDMGNYRTEKTILPIEEIIIAMLEFTQMMNEK